MKIRLFLWIFAAALAAAQDSAEVRLKDLVSIEGVRENQLIGYGLVVGLNSTGDHQTTYFSAQSLANMLQQMGVSINPTQLLVKDTAAVMVTATLPPFAQPGMHIDVTAGAIGDAQNLQGGMLLLTSLKGVDGQVYALAQGPVVTGGFGAGRGGNSEVVNHPTVGRVPAGAMVERGAPSIPPKGEVRLLLRDPDFATALRISRVINEKFPDAAKPLADPETSSTVAVRIPPDYTTRVVEFMAGLEDLQVRADRVARVVINERTGTIVMGKEVRVAPVAIMHGKLTVEIRTVPIISQPNGLSQGKTTVAPLTTVNAHEDTSRNLVLEQGATVEELVRALGTIGSTARDVIAILESLHAAGALEAEIEVI
ncbi:MAG TPA: flagellar basal body P-ring protein FlgI [Bryobacteraceae bacterium]|jgi:flagellar P-ring protein FlgI|nr:flagellar basal body P-ring protein FlgI [Bryobacteraceae bacterium]